MNEDPQTEKMIRLKKREIEDLLGFRISKPNKEVEQKIESSITFPVLLINWSDLCPGLTKSFFTPGLGKVSKPDINDFLELIQEKRRDILENFETSCERLFSTQSAIHADTSTWDSLLSEAPKQPKYPPEISNEHVWGPLYYPKMIGNYDVIDCWEYVTRPSKYSSGSFFFFFFQFYLFFLQK